MPDPPPASDKRTIANPEDFRPNPPAPYVELAVTSSFTFLRGASDPIDLVLTAHCLGYDALGITDRNSMAGAVRHWMEANTAKLRPITGCRLDLTDAPSFYVYPKTRAAYGRLTTLLSAGKMSRPDGSWQDKGACEIDLAQLAVHLGHTDEAVLIVIPGENLDGFATDLPRLCEALPVLGHVAAAYLYRGNDRSRIARLDRIARAHGLRIVAVNDVHYHVPQRRPLQDVMTCIREKCTIFDAGTRLDANAERHLKSPADMVRLFADWPDAIHQTRIIADACTFSLGELRYEYPEEVVPAGVRPAAYLADLTWAGALYRYPEGVPEKVQKLIRHELDLIAELDIPRYFLTIRDIVNFARRRDILCQGRGSAANSAVCYCLGITSVDPAKHEVLFERFISKERKEPPDIDVDFEHERREEVIQHIYERYGRKRAGLCATVIHYRPRMAIREVGKVMGLSEDITAALARTVWGSWGSSIDENKVAEAGLDLSDPHLRRTIALADQLIGMPRHLSQHVGGFVLTQGPLVESAVVGNGAMPDRSFIEWDKDDIEALGILKVDVLALGMLTCIRKCFDLIAAHYGRRYTLATVPPEDEATYAMLQKGDSLGVFQVESRAQMNMLPRLKPKEFYDLVIEVAIVRPGPIQGDMVHPYLRRRQGKEPVVYPRPGPDHPQDELENILKRTLGVPIFQEQAMKIAMDAAKFSSVEANQLRKAMATFRSRGMVSNHKEKMVGRMVERGYDPEFAARCFSQIEGFGEYGFPESHAASFAHLVYVSSWLKRHYPEVFACALLNSQPMGFYAPAQIVRDAREHGVEVRPADVNMSDWDNGLEPCGNTQARPAGAARPDGRPHRFALRLGLRQIDGLRQDDAARLLRGRRQPYDSIAQLRTASGMSVAGIERMAAADAFRSLGRDRRQALWDARALKAAPDLPLFVHADTADEGADVPALLPAMPLSEHVVADYQTMRLSLKAHPMAFLRPGYARAGFLRAADLRSCRFNQHVSVSGIVLIRQRPGSAKGVVFVTLEDESGVVNLVVWPDTLNTYRKQVMSARLMTVHGTVQMDDAVIHVVARQIVDDTARLDELSGDRLRAPLARADHVVSPLPSHAGRHPRDVRVIPKSRDFH